MLFPKAPLQLAAVTAGLVAVVAAQQYNLVDHYDSSNWFDMFSVQSVLALLFTSILEFAKPAWSRS